MKSLRFFYLILFALSHSSFALENKIEVLCREDVVGVICKIPENAGRESFVNITGAKWDGKILKDKSSNLHQQEIIEITLDNFSTRIPKNIGVHFIKISNLIIHNSNLNRIQRDDFVSMTKLEKLQLYENKIETIAPDALSDLNNLEYFDLDRNVIFELPGELLLMAKNFRIFKAAYNFIEEIPRELFNNTKMIQKIHLRSNKITNFDFIAKVSHNFEHLIFIDLKLNNEQRCNVLYSVEHQMGEKDKGNQNYQGFKNNLYQNIEQCASKKLSQRVKKEDMESTTFNLNEQSRKDDDDYNA